MFCHGSAPSCLRPKRHALPFAIELQNPHVDLFADLDDFGRMLDALPRHVGDVQQAVDAAQVDEGAVVGEILDHTLDRRTLLQIVQQRGPLCAVFLLDDRAARHDHVVALLIELDDLEFERLVLQVRRIAHRTHIDQRTRQERAHVVDLDGEAALDAARDDADDHFLLFEGRFEARPRSGTLGLFARETGFSRTVLDAVQGDFDGLAHDDLDLTFFVLELVGGNYRLGFQSDVDDDVVLAYFDDQSIEDGARTNALARDALFEQFRKTFCHVVLLLFPGTVPVCPRGYQKITAIIHESRNLNRQTPAGHAQDALNHCTDGHPRSIQQDRVCACDKRRNRAVHIAPITLRYLQRKGGKGSSNPLFFQLLMAPCGPFRRARREKNLDIRLREYHGPHVAPVRHQTRGDRKAPLALQVAPREPGLRRRPWRRHFPPARSEWRLSRLFRRARRPPRRQNRSRIAG